MEITGGFRRYFYEYLIHQSLQRASDNGAARHEGELTTRHRNYARARIDELLAESGYSMDQPNLSYTPLINSIEAAAAELYPNAEPLFPDYENTGGKHPEINGAYMRFAQAAGLGGPTSQGNLGGPRLLISPHDPRWSHRSTVMAQGNQLLSIDGDTVDRYITGLDTMDPLETNNLPLSQAYPEDEVSDRLRTLGDSQTVEDRSGLTALRPFMSDREYKQTREWALEAAKVDGKPNFDGEPEYDDAMFMGKDARDRAVAVLDDLASSGVEYEITPDRNPGQLKVRIKGTGIDVRVMDTAMDQEYVGSRVYDRGKVYTYSITTSGDKAAENRYTPTPKEAVDLVRFARGEEVYPEGWEAPVGWVNAKGEQKQGGPMERAYHDAGQKGMFLYGEVQNSRIPKQNGRPLRIQAMTVKPSTEYFPDQEVANARLRDYVGMAQTSMSKSLNITAMHELATDNTRLEEEPEFSTNEEIADLQRLYWSQLSQYRGEAVADNPEPQPLLLPGYTMGEYLQAEEAGDGEAMAAMATTIHYDPELGRTLPVEPLAAVEAHAGAYIRDRIGTYELDEDGVRFNPIEVARNMDTGEGMLTNRDNIIAALRKSEVTPEQLRGEDFNNNVIAERMISYDESTATNIFAHDNEMMRSFGNTIYRSIMKSGAQVKEVEINGQTFPDIHVDDQGVVKWRAERRLGRFDHQGLDEDQKYHYARNVEGEIGQIWVPGDKGEIVTKFGHGENHMFVPGYVATIVPQTPGEVKSVEERTKLRGYEQMMNERISYQVSENLLRHQSEVGEPTALNSVYRNLYGHKLPENFTELTAEEGMSEELRDVVLDTMGRRVRYTKDIADGASLRSKLFAERYDMDFLNDNTRDPLALTAGRDLTRLHGEIGSGYFDPDMTGTGHNHGPVRYLAESAQVGEDGFMIKGIEGDQAPMNKTNLTKNGKYDPHSRKVMTASALLQASAVTEGTSVAMMDLKGWNFEDGIVVSKKYAEENMIRATDGEMRALKVGDKLSDIHGNKGVISLVVDPEMTPEEAAESQLTEEVNLFKDNDGLEVVMSPFSFVSRQNGGSARDLIDSAGEGARDLVIDGEVVEGGIGKTNIVITHMAVDAKTNIYDAEAMRAGKGRKASGQLAWAVQSQGCDELMNYFYGNNDAGIAKTREFAVALGYDILPDTQVKIGYDVENSPQRNVIELKNPPTNKSGNIGKYERDAIRADIGKRLGDAGGVMELPFEIELASGEKTPQIGVDEATGRPRYGLPVLSASLRDEQELADGSVSTHDHTTKYSKIYEQAAEYEHALNKADMAGSQRERQRILSQAQEKITAAQGHYGGLVSDIKNHKVESKHNMFRSQIMSTRVDHSATAVWTADPRLSVNQVAMNSEMARELGVTRNKGKDCLHDDSVGHTLLWRDPVWRDSGLRYMEVTIDDNLEGVAINPVVASSFDGDFDGDAVGLVSHLPPKVHDEVVTKLTMEMNTLDLGQGVEQEDGTMRYPLSTAHEQDTVLATSKNPELAELYEEIVDNAHDNLAQFRAGEIDMDSYRETNKAVLEDLDTFYQEALSKQYGDAAVSFKDIGSHLDSVTKSYQRVDEATGEVIEHGAKGSPGKFHDYTLQIGAEQREDGTWYDHGESLISQEERAKEQAAMGIKTLSVGDAGTKSHMAVRLMRKQGLIAEAAHTSYAATQSILQAKKDPVDAIYREKVVSEYISNQWSGYALKPGEDENGRYTWEVERDEEGNPKLATKEQWVNQYMEMYSSKKGMGVPVSKDMVVKIADSLSDKDGQMLDLSKENWDNLPEDKRPTNLDKMAYSGTLEDFHDIAMKQERLLDGPNTQFASNTVLQNMRSMSAEIEGAPVHYIETKDTKVVEATTGKTLASSQEHTAMPAHDQPVDHVPLSVAAAVANAEAGPEITEDEMAFIAAQQDAQMEALGVEVGEEQFDATEIAYRDMGQQHQPAPEPVASDGGWQPPAQQKFQRWDAERVKQEEQRLSAGPTF